MFLEIKGKNHIGSFDRLYVYVMLKANDKKVIRVAAKGFVQSCKTVKPLIIAHYPFILISRYYFLPRLKMRILKLPRKGILVLRRNDFFKKKKKGKRDLTEKFYKLMTAEHFLCYLVMMWRGNSFWKWSLMRDMPSYKSFDIFTFLMYQTTA